ncbi:uncharacterized protein LOC122535979 [Frieseomelitta varia]|uniref:uncharacterized protein LOC122535979 n=1 Tax=Frieseomelitta varia TaxID=561572 RepID=UPI001CB67BEF|nr:uncharacterized protein LOC122535979 [Frieseomelitta varia]
MADEDKKDTKNQVEELYAWISKIPLSKPTKNLSRDLSDAVIIAEILKIYYPRYVDLHNYVSVNSITAKKDNWNMLNRKVLSKIDMKLTKSVINQLANCHPGAAENMLLDIRKKIVQDGVDLQIPQKQPQNDFVEEGNIPDDESVPCSVAQPTSNSLDSKTSIFSRAKQMISFIFGWFISWLCIWNYFQDTKLQLTNQLRNFLEENAKASNEKNINEETDVRVKIVQKMQELHVMMCNLNHKLTYLESITKLKDL